MLIELQAKKARP
jgi:hypothetical protein